MTHLDYNFTKLYRISRPKLAFPRGAPDHWGLAIHDYLQGEWWVWHTTPEKGSHLVCLEEFVAGLPYVLEEIHPTSEIWQRLAQDMSMPRAYCPFFDNCQQLVTKIIEGKPRSPTLSLLIGLLLFGLILWNVLGEPRAIGAKAY